MPKRPNNDGLAPRKWRDRWRAAATVGYDQRGKQIQKYVYGKTERECLDKLNDLKRQIGEGMSPVKDMTLSQWIDEWLKAKKAELEPKTVREYRYTWRHAQPYVGRHKLGSLTPLHVQRMQLAVSEQYSRRAAVQARRLVHNALDDAMRLGLVARNVAASVKPVKYEKAEYSIWSADEVEKFLQSAQESAYYPLFYLALTSGMRPGELIALHWVDVRGSKISVHRTLELTTGKIKDRPKTRHGRRVIDIPEDTVSVLAEHQRYQSNSELVFPSSNHKPLNGSNIRRSLHTFAEKAEVKPIRTHDLRHTYAAMAIASGMNVMRLARQLGHADPSFTLRTYGHIFERHQPHSAYSLSELLGVEDSSNGIL